MLSRSEGSVTAELALVLPVIILILGICLQAVSALGIQLSNAALARQAAQELSRGVALSLVATTMQRANHAAQLSQSSEGELVCVSLEQEVGPGPLGLLIPTVRVRECVVDAH